MKDRRWRSGQSLFFSILALFALHPVHSAVSGNAGNRLAASPGAAIVRNVASTLTVTSGNDSGPGTLRQAIIDAMDGDTIQFAAGLTTITLTSGDINITKRLTISGPGASVLTVKRDRSTAPFRIFTINVGKTVSLSGLTISGGNANFGFGGGGGIINNGKLTISNSIISGNSASDGGGGGINNSFLGTLTISNSTIAGNSANFGFGGGIFNSGTLMVNNITIAGNASKSFGGGGISNFGTLTISDSTISGNSADFIGGGIGNGGTLMISNSTISGNTTINSGFGGGIFNGFISTLTISNSTISGNSAGDGNGGGLDNQGTVTVNNSTISGNSASFGGGILNFNVSTLNLYSSIIANNTAPAGPDIIGAVTLGDYNLIKSTSGISGSLPGSHNITGQDPLLGPLQNSGGPTQTMALLAGSPAIDQGKNFTTATADQRGLGFARTFDDPAVMNAAGGDGTDIGAFEVQPTFNLCLQDDSSGNLLQINTTTGDYQFTNCAGLTIGGTGILSRRGSTITLQHNASDRRVMATIDTATNRATASIQLLSQGRTFSITDRNITNDTCACR